MLAYVSVEHLTTFRYWWYVKVVASLEVSICLRGLIAIFHLCNFFNKFSTVFKNTCNVSTCAIRRNADQILQNLCVCIMLMEKYCRLLVRLILRCSWVSEHVCSCLCLAGSGWWSGIVLHSNYNVDRRRKSLTEAMVFIIYYIEDGLFFFLFRSARFSVSVSPSLVSFHYLIFISSYFPLQLLYLFIFFGILMGTQMCFLSLAQAVCLCTTFTTDLNI